MLDLLMQNASISYPGLNSPVLSIDRLAVSPGERVVITGASGSGKSTLVNLITGLERLGSGSLKWGNTDISGLSESRRDRWRGENIGLVMQDFHLFPGLSALENILLPARLSRAVRAETVGRAQELVARVGLKRPEQRIETMSRGEMQRVAVARAVLRRPAVIVADEPTASLDPESGAAVVDLLLDLAASEGSTLIAVSHDHRLIERLDRRLVLEAGQVLSDTQRAAA